MGGSGANGLRTQGCALAEPGGPWGLTFALGRLGNLSFLIQILQFQSTGLPSIFLRTQPWNCIVLTLLTFSFYRKLLFRSVSD